MKKYEEEGRPRWNIVEQTEEPRETCEAWARNPEKLAKQQLLLAAL